MRIKRDKVVNIFSIQESTKLSFLYQEGHSHGHHPCPDLISSHCIIPTALGWPFNFQFSLIPLDLTYPASLIILKPLLKKKNFPHSFMNVNLPNFPQFWPLVFITNGFPGGTSGFKRCQFDPWVRKIPWRRA